MRNPKRTTLYFLLLSNYGFFLRGYWYYSREEHAYGVAGYLEMVHGHADAPFQYRILLVEITYFLYQHAHIPFRYGFTLLDIVSSTIAILLGYSLLSRSRHFSSATVPAQWLASAAYSSLVLYLFAWQDWYKKPETDPSAAAVLLFLWLLTPSDDTPRQRTSGPRLVGLLLVILAQCFIRADIALSLGLGLLSCACLRRRGPLSLSRPHAIITGAVCVAGALVIQVLMMKVIFPHARPYAGPVFMLPHDVGHPVEDLTCLVFAAPALWAIRQAWKWRFTEDAGGLAILLASIPFLVLWITLGRLEEVRIFLPMGLGLAPITAELLLLQNGDTAPATSFH